MTNELFKQIHNVIFGEHFMWAGRWRTVNSSKAGVVWPAAAFLDRSKAGYEKDVFRRLPSQSLTTDADFCHAFSENQGEFLAIHPFRKGNAHIVKLATDLIVAQTGRPLLRYDQLDRLAVTSNEVTLPVALALRPV